MRTIDRIRSYIVTQQNAGLLKPGSRLKSCQDLMRECGGSYATVRTAMSKLQQEGLVDIRNGVGTFLAGGSPLAVRLNLNSAILPATKLQKLLDKFLAQTELNLEIEYHLHKQQASETGRLDFSMDTPEITITSYANSLHSHASLLTRFPDYPELLHNLRLIEPTDNHTVIPFCYFPYQMAFSRALLQRIGFPLERINCSFDWWEDYVTCCRRAGIVPVSAHWPTNSTIHFSNFLGPLLALIEYDKQNYCNRNPLFATQEGRRFLQIIKDTYLYRTAPDQQSFYGGKTGMAFMIGSWIMAQNHIPDWPDCQVDDLVIVPLMHCERRILPIHVNYLSVHLPDHLNADENKRIWALIKLLLSHDFQQDFCSQTGSCSVRGDIGASEYTWNADERGNEFFPASPDDLVVHTGRVFNESVLTALTLLAEDYLFYGADAEVTLQRMDEKKNLENTVPQIYHGMDAEVTLKNI